MKINLINQIDLFDENQTNDEDIIIKIEDWKFEERLSKEFESVGFFISDHPINQFKDILKFIILLIIQNLFLKIIFIKVI